MKVMNTIIYMATISTIPREWSHTPKFSATPRSFSASVGYHISKINNVTTNF
jgi:hypothetical protein